MPKQSRRNRLKQKDLPIIKTAPAPTTTITGWLANKAAYLFSPVSLTIEAFLYDPVAVVKKTSAVAIYWAPALSISLARIAECRYEHYLKAMQEIGQGKSCVIIAQSIWQGPKASCCDPADEDFIENQAKEKTANEFITPPVYIFLKFAFSMGTIAGLYIAVKTVIRDKREKEFKAAHDATINGFGFFGQSDRTPIDDQPAKQRGWFCFRR